MTYSSIIIYLKQKIISIHLDKLYLNNNYNNQLNHLLILSSVSIQDFL